MPIDRLPLRVKTHAYKIRDWLKTDSPLMIILGIVSLFAGIAYVVDPPNPPLRQMEDMTFVDFFGFLWIIAGVMLLATSGFSRTKLAAFSLSAVVILCFMWSGSLLTKFLFEHAMTSLSRALQYAAFGFLVMYIVWFKSTAEEQKTFLPTAKEVKDVLRDDPS